MMDTLHDAPRTGLAARPQWQALLAHAEQVRERHLRDWFAAEPDRGTRLVAESAGLYLDYSKQRVGQDTLGLLFELADACGLQARIDAMFAGRHINFTEDRAALHVALRAPAGERIEVDGVDVVAEVQAVLTRMPRSPSACAMAAGPAQPESASATSSTSASAVPTSVR